VEQHEYFTLPARSGVVEVNVRDETMTMTSGSQSEGLDPLS